MIEWRTSRPDVTCDTPSQVPITGKTGILLPGPLAVRILLWLLIFAAFPLSVTAAQLSFNLEVRRHTLPAALPPGAPRVDLAERVLIRLEAAERKESDPWLRDDIRIAWITTLYASHGNSQPHVDATYRVLGLHPDKVWPAICARRAALIGKDILWRTSVNSADRSVIATATTPEDSRNPQTAPISMGDVNAPTIATSGTSSPKKPCASVDRHGKRRAA